MKYFLYSLGIRLYELAIKSASIFQPKAAKWVSGRSNWEEEMRLNLPQKSSWIWFHCASLGEFEQGRNLIDHIKIHNPEVGILVSFFSPSGYEIRKSYPNADWVCYLPLDTKKNAKKFLDLLNPKLVCFVKYELWLNFLSEIANRSIPSILLSARVRKNSAFFSSPISSLYKQAFKSFDKIFTQDESSAQLLRDFSGNSEIMVSSDTRYDRVSANRENFLEIPEVSNFKKNRLCIVAGSTWPKAEAMLLEAFNELFERYNLCIILAPHEIRESRITEWEQKYPEISLRFSQIEQLNGQHRILWIDNIGMLSRLYHYGEIAYVGGGWGSGLHNILEAAAFGCPVLIGPVHDKFPEAGEMIAAGGCFEIQDTQSLGLQLKSLAKNPELRDSIHRINTTFIEERSGATEIVISWMKEKGFIT